MLYDLYDLAIPPTTAVLLFGALAGLVFGAAAQIARFCLRRGIVAGADRPAALGTWAFALFVALAGTQAATGLGWIDLSAHRFAAPAVPYLAAILGGLSFGAGMVLTRGCAGRLTVLAGTGNLRAALVLVVFAIVAHATLKGVLAPLRVAIGSVTADLGPAATLAGLPGGGALWAAVLSVGLLLLVRNSGAPRLHLGLAALIGLLVPLGWAATGTLLNDPFEPLPLETLSFTAPWTATLFWTVAATSISAGFGPGLVGGTLVGAFVAAGLRRELRLVSFDSAQQTLRYFSGAALMGFGGVLAGGCTIGAGLSGVSALSVAALLALAAIVAGARVMDVLLTSQKPADAVAIPAE